MKLDPHCIQPPAVAAPGFSRSLSCRAPSAQAAAPAVPLPSDAVIHDYLMRHPEVVMQAMKAAEAKEHEDALAQSRLQIAAHGSDLAPTAADAIAGNPKGDVTIVEFFDYQCPYCKTMAPTLQQAARADHGVRIVYKDIPILGPGSLIAARAALASRAQDKYLAFHEALMATKGQLSEESVMAAAAGIGLDTARLKRDMKDPAIDAEIGRNLDLARTLGISGTPAMIVGGALAPGAIELDDLQAMVAQARKG